MIVYILNGAPKCGKGVFVEFLEIFTDSTVTEYSSIDWVKDLASDVFGWDGEKTAKSRKLLSDLKKLAIEWDDIPLKLTIKKIRYATPTSNFFCTDVREPEEIKKLQTWCKEQGIPCYAVLIRREVAEEKAIADGITNSSDTEYLNYEYDYMIKNDGSLEEYKRKITALAYIHKMDI